MSPTTPMHSGPDPVHPSPVPVIPVAQSPEPTYLQNKPSQVPAQATNSNLSGSVTPNATEPRPDPVPPTPASIVPAPVVPAQSTGLTHQRNQPVLVAAQVIDPNPSGPIALNGTQPAPTSPVVATTPPQTSSGAQSLSSRASNSPPNTPSKPQIPSFRTVITEWRWELFTWALGTLATIIILVIFLVFKDKSLATWKGQVQITAMIAIFTQAAESALIVSVASCIGQSKHSWLKSPREKIEIEHFDEASRGPEGSLMLLLLALRHPFERMRPSLQSVIVYTGALVTLLMLGFGAAAQQALSIDIRGVESTTPAAHVNRALQYHPIQFPVQGLAGLDDVITGTIFKGKFSAFKCRFNPRGCDCIGIEHQPQPVRRCSRLSVGNCVWNGYTTLGICSSVEDVTFNLTSSTKPSNGETPPIFILNTPLGVTQAVEYSPFTYPDAMGPCEFNMRTILNPYYGADTLSDLPIQNIANVYIVYFPTCALTGNVSGVIESVGNWTPIHRDPKNWRAFHGTIELCLLNLSSTVVNATTTTTIANRVDMEEPSLWDSDGDLMVFPDGNNHSTFNITFESVRSLAGHMFSLLNGSGVLIPAYKQWDNEWAFSVGGDIYGGDPFVCTPEPIGGLPAFGRRLNNIALSLTNTMRTNVQGSDPITGIMVTNEQYVNVNLLWYIFPLVMWATITAILALTILQTVFSDVPTWKASTLPLLDCVDPKSAFRSLREVKQLARKDHIQLVATGTTWQLQHQP